ncbi:putative glycosyltransferase EpsJ [Anaerohalosphaera lusitana]|uniref:Putative glycosyltransferase EpsJ n=1 Tax=Anaerohalosphaera lusitana TaxID=1936003 RepID=A0A1U9NPF7_9BACT|nr:glycosyltransferase family A protein [Anaerohalosphaera lusitana]AQT69624.1 putative glycosyltransferase EpsJ [Anaerohalosphaera lusitana]
MPDQYDKTTISIVIAAYNAAEHLPRAVKSVLAQTIQPNEIIVVDDGSTDNTKQVLEQFGDRIKYIYQNNAGPGAARNTGIQTATSEWISFLDADDEYLPNKLETQLEILARHPDLHWITGNYIRCLCDTQTRVPLRTKDEINQILNGSDTYDDFMQAFTIGVFGWTGTMLIRRNAILKAGMFPTDIYLAEDIDLWLKIAYNHPRIGFAYEPLAIYHMGVQGSLARNKASYADTNNFLSHHLKLAKQHNCEDAFQPCARRILVAWIRSALFDDRVKNVRSAINDFRNLLPPGLYLFFYVLSIFPQLTMKTCLLLSAISRKLRLRKRVWHPTD